MNYKYKLNKYIYKLNNIKNNKINDYKCIIWRSEY